MTRLDEISVLAVIVNYRTPELALDCLRSIAGEIESLPRLQAVVVDNASCDDSVALIRAGIAAWPWASLLELPANRGFSAGNNAAICPRLTAPTPPRYVLLLNPDTIVRPGAVAEPVRFMEEHPQIGIVGPRLEDPDGTPQRSAFRFPSVLGELENGTRLGLLSRVLAKHTIAPPAPEHDCQTDWLSGACLLIRKQVFDDIGYLDEGYFLYFEEVDFCRRAANAGWASWYVPSSRVVHLVGQVTGWTTRNRRPRYWFDSRKRYFQQHLGTARTLTANVAWAAGYASYRLRRPFQGKIDADPKYLLSDFVRFNLIPSRAS